MIQNLILVLITTIFINNVLLSQFLGLCSFLGVSKKTETAVGMGGAVIFVITISSAVTNLIYNFILVKFNLEYMKTIVFIVVIAALVQLVEMVLKKYVPSLYKALGVYLPLITTNCAVLGVALTNVQVQYTSNLQSFIFSIISGFGTSVGYLVAILILAGIRERIEHNEIPESFKGMPIVLISAGLMAIAFMGFAGL
ncbi:electron transport complex protein RnfA [Clostridium gallinarum]|uniref:electron transport complex protein RnfA n=1 Tax=Clostridium gallinarum TaxID=2762246 RepID=UPI001A9B4676|nr:electron transport complex protein RnfA [Clostridium gallinarum]